MPKQYDWTRAERRLLEELAERCDAAHYLPPGSLSGQVLAELRYQCEVKPLRTQAEVDADIGRALRAAVCHGASLGRGSGDINHSWACTLRELAAEKVAK